MSQNPKFHLRKLKRKLQRLKDNDDKSHREKGGTDSEIFSS